jgi:hypothetical protein
MIAYSPVLSEIIMNLLNRVFQSCTKYNAANHNKWSTTTYSNSHMHISRGRHYVQEMRCIHTTTSKVIHPNKIYNISISQWHGKSSGELLPKWQVDKEVNVITVATTQCVTKVRPTGVQRSSFHILSLYWWHVTSEKVKLQKVYLTLWDTAAIFGSVWQFIDNISTQHWIN